MGREFVAAANQPAVDDESLTQTLAQLSEHGVLKVAENGSVCGVIGALVFPNYWNVNELIAQELFWWVDEAARGTSAGVRLLSAAEDACRDRGAKKLLMLCLNDLDGDRVAQMYQRRGYEPQEQAYRKVL